MTTNVTYGVDADTIKTYLPGVPVDDAAMITPARLTTIVSHAAARVNGVLLSAGFTPADIAADTSTVGYINCQRLTAILALPHILNAITTAAPPANLKALIESAERDLTKIATTPTALGFADNSTSPAAASHISIMGLPTDQASINKRRPYVQHDSPSNPNKRHW